MGHAKHLMAVEEQKTRVAQDIAHRAGCLDYCEDHEVYIDNMAGEPVEAYKLGHVLCRNEYSGVFDDARDMTNHIKDAVQDSAMDCWGCEKMMRD